MKMSHATGLRALFTTSLLVTALFFLCAGCGKDERKEAGPAQSDRSAPAVSPAPAEPVKAPPFKIKTFDGKAVHDPEENARMFVKKFGLTFPTGFDATGQIMRDYQINFMPRTYFIGKDGMLLYVHHGMMNEEQLLLAITQLSKDESACKTC